MLRARDFRVQGNTESQLRWWHNRALHNAFGVSVGLTTTPQPQTGPLTAIQVDPGVAYDCGGRLILLQRQQVVPVPQAAPQGVSILDLAIRFKEGSRFPSQPEISGTCPSRQRTPFEEAPDFVWRPGLSVELTDGVPIAQVKYDASGPSLDTAFIAPSSRALSRPHIATGTTIAGATRWESWALGDRNAAAGAVARTPRVIGLQTAIDTSAAGFTQVPKYFASLQDITDLTPQDRTHIPFVFTSVTNVSLSGFTFRILLVHMPIPSPVKTLYVCWLGCQDAEEVDACLPGSSHGCCS
jgi:hypothetical protein